MRPAALVLTAVLALSLAACDVASQTGTGQPAQPAPSAPLAVDPGPAIDTDALVAAAAATDGQAVRVKGFLLAMDGTTRLCSIVMESYPPQCGGGTVTLEGDVPDDVVVGLDRTKEPDLAKANWGWVEVTGTFDATGTGGTPTIAISEIRLAAP